LTELVSLANIALVQAKEKSINILGIETSCNETAFVVADGQILRFALNDDFQLRL